MHSVWFQLSTGGASTPAVCCRDQDGRGEAFWDDPVETGVCNGCATVFTHFAWFCILLHPLTEHLGKVALKALVQFQETPKATQPNDGFSIFAALQ